MDLETLKTLAQQATFGPWTYDSADTAVYPSEAAVVADHPVWIVEPLTPGTGPDYRLQQQHNCRFIAALSPDVVLALIAEIERLRKETT